MPEISRFLGIVITLYTETGVQHNLPHFHVRYAGYKAVYGIDPVVQLEGAQPIAQQRMVEAWAEIYKAEIKRAWEIQQAGSKAPRIRGLV